MHRMEINKGAFDSGWACGLSIAKEEHTGYVLAIDLGKYYFNIWLLDKGVG